MKSKNTKTRIGKILKKLRIANCLNRQAVASFLEIKTKDYKAIEAGRKNLFMGKVILLARYYDISLDIFK